jgi:replication-associated recombination protein RarA
MTGKKQRGKNDSTPDNYKPGRPNELIGPARKIAADLLRLAERVKDGRNTLKLLLYGKPGNCKTDIAGMICKVLAAGTLDVQSINGRNVSIDEVRYWQQNTAYGSLFGGWKVKLINEADLIPQIAQDLLLTYLDELPDHNAVLGTSNLDLGTLTERFQTRFRLVHVKPPTSGELARWLMQRWHVPKATADFIAVGADGNVRQALLDASTFQTHRKVDARPKPPVVVKDLAASERAKKAWETMRSRGLPNNGSSNGKGK